jgi:hypothetical protein
MLARRNPRRHSSNSGNQERSTFTIWPMVVAIPPLFSGPTAQRFSIDAGTTDDSLEVPSAQKPNANIRPGEWIASYILREMQAAGRRPVSKPMNIRISWSEIWQPMGKCGREKARIHAGIFRSYKFCSNKTTPPRTCARWQFAASRRAAERFG